MASPYAVTTLCGDCKLKTSTNGLCDAGNGPARWFGPAGISSFYATGSGKPMYAVADTSRNEIRSMTFEGADTTPTANSLAGTGSGGGADGAALSAEFTNPIAVDFYPSPPRPARQRCSSPRCPRAACAA